MYEQQIREDTLLIIFYAGVATATLLASCYLLLRRGNAFAPEVTPPLRLRRWTAAFLAAIALCHMWYLPVYLFAPADKMLLAILVATLLDTVTVIPLSIVVLLVMLQDRRRPLWPVAVMVAPFVVGLSWCIVKRSDALQPVMMGYFLLMWVGFGIYMIRAIKQYGHWLRNNFADLEHKEVVQGFVILGIILLTYILYSFEGELIYRYAMETITLVLVSYLLWRVETLSDLSLLVDDVEEETDIVEDDLPSPAHDNIGPLLEQFCENTQLYLQYDVSANQLAKLIGTNRLYLSQYFNSQGITYKTYINRLRVQHFIKLYQKTVTAYRPVKTKQLAYQSGFRSYSTFCAAFKQWSGMTPTEWMRSAAQST